MNNKGVKEMCIATVRMAVEDWKYLCEANVKSLAEKGKPVVVKKRGNEFISFNGIASFFLKDPNGIMTVIDIDGYTVLEELLKIKGSPSKEELGMPDNNLLGNGPRKLGKYRHSSKLA